MEKKSGKLKAALLLIMATLLWGSSFVVTKGAVDGIPLLLLVGLRLFPAGIFLGLVFFKHFKNLNKDVLIVGLIIGAVYTCGIALQNLGIQVTSAGRSAFVTSAYCIITPFLDWIIIKKKPQFTNLLAAAVCMLGVAFIVLDGDFTLDVGDVYTLAGSVCFAFQIVLVGKYVRKYDEILLSILYLLFAGLIALIISFFTETFPAHMEWSTVLSIAYLAFVCTGVAAVFQAKSQKVLSASTMTVILGFEAIFASVISAIVMDETFSGQNLIGCALVFLSSFVSLLEKNK